MLVAYDNGHVVVLDTAACSCLTGGDCGTSKCSTKGTVGSIQSENSGQAPIRLIRAHPTKRYALLVGEDQVVSVWNMKTLRCVHTLECDEPIIDIEYQLNGTVIVLALLHSGVFNFLYFSK